jgi:UDP-glucose-4-epimerase GalE
MRIFVTGGAGYVGSHCVRALCDAGHEITILDNLCGGHRQAADKRAKLIVGDVGDAGLLDKAFAAGRFDAVMHFAAHLDVNESVREPLKYYRNNVAHTVTLLEGMAKHGIERMVFSSTCATYGVPPSVPITEEMAQLPISPYGRTKLAMEWMLRDCAKAAGIGSTALRYFNASGASADGTIGEDHDPESHLIPLVLQVALGQRDDIKVFGVDYPTPDGSCVRDYIHVEDLAEVHRIAIETQQPGEFRCYNVGTGSGVSVKELVEVAREVTGHDIPAVPSDRREGDPPELYADPTKVTTELGWQPKYADIRPILETAWQWHRSHPDGFEKV